MLELWVDGTTVSSRWVADRFLASLAEQVAGGGVVVDGGVLFLSVGFAGGLAVGGGWLFVSVGSVGFDG